MSSVLTPAARFDASAAVFQHGVKGIAYDWRAVVAEVAARRLDADLAAVVVEPA